MFVSCAHWLLHLHYFGHGAQHRLGVVGDDVSAILTTFFFRVKTATSLADVNIAAGIAERELMDLGEECDRSRTVFEVPERANLN